MMKIKNADSWGQESLELNKEAMKILENEDSSAEDLERAEKLMEASTEAMAKSNAMRELDVMKNKVLGDLKNDKDQNQDDGNNDEKQNAGEFAHMGEFFQSAWHMKKNSYVDERLFWWGGNDDKAPNRVLSTKALAESVGATGGFLVPDEFQERILSILNQQSIVSGRAEVIRMSSSSIKVPVLDQTGTTVGTPSWYGGMVARWEGESTQLTETQPAFRQLELTARKLTVYTPTSNELLQDSAQSLEDFLLGNRGFPGLMAWTTDRAYLRGDGNGKPRGIIGSGAEIATTRAGANAVGYADLTAMLTNFLPSGNALWIAHQTVLDQLLQMSGPSGNASFLWGGAQAGVPNTLLGHPIIFTDRLPVLGSAGDIMLVDLGFYVIGDRQRMTIDASTEERFRNDETSWRATMRVDGRPWLSAPITYEDGTTTVSPFVILAA
jgi:HK97 family phage major capsid protein